MCVKRSIASLLLASIPLAIGVVFGAAQAMAHVTERVSVSSRGDQGNDRSFGPAISADGRFIAFTSRATNLVPGDTNRHEDVFVHDRQTGVTTRVSVDSAGVEGNGRSWEAAINSDGRCVAFTSDSRLVPGDSRIYDVFVHDRETGATTRVSVDSRGRPGNNQSAHPSISADGRFVAFESFAGNLVPDDTNNSADVFLHDRSVGQTLRVGVWPAGQQIPSGAHSPAISSDGRRVAFTSGYGRVFVYDTQTGRGEPVSISNDGVQASAACYPPHISADGQLIVYASRASNLVLHDTNRGLDVFLRDRQAGETALASVNSAGEQIRASSHDPAISGSGRFVAFRVGWLTGQAFVHDRQARRTEWASVSGMGRPANGKCSDVAISADGQFIAFASEASNLASGDTNGLVDVFVARNPSARMPVLSWAAEAGFLADGVHPDQGTGRDTRFTFKVRYEGFPGNAPRSVDVHLRRNGRYWGELSMVRGVGDYTTGRVYRRARRLPPGSYEHCFRARDRDGEATGAPTAWTRGPIVEVDGGAGLALTSLAAVPTSTGAQITFSLSAPAQVQTRILNIAGRPMRTICQAQECEAGTTTLVWDAQSENGLRVPNGMYLIEIEAAAETGSRSRAMAQLRLTR